MKNVKFGTDGIRGRVGEPPIDCQTILHLGWSLGRMIYEAYGPSKIIIGKDTRISGYMIESLLEAGIIAAGCDAILLGPIPTPGIAYLTKAFRSKASVVISASHNIYSDNGIKLFNANGFKFSKNQQEKLLKYMTMPIVMVDSEDLGRAQQIHTASERYVEFCKSKFSSKLSLNGMKIVLDCANGANYKVGPEVFEELGAEVKVMNANPDGTNINDKCGSLYPELLQKSVLDEHADVGIAFDGDGDRLLMVSQSGRICDGDDLLFILGQYLCEKNMGVVGTFASNNGLKKAFASKGIAFKQTDVGDHKVIESLLESNWLIGGESSGHLIQLDKNTCSDAIISALSVLNIMLIHAKTLDQLLKPLEKIPSHSFNIPLCESIDLNAHKDSFKQMNTKLGEFGKLLVRKSGTEPVIRVLVEGELQSDVDRITSEVKSIFSYV
ncbi:MAG: phosphoglucosamine mutase [Pseudomonadota bacterium]|nr:phosphoglucosamine mutase [Pseudomonadota bacterium]